MSKTNRSFRSILQRSLLLSSLGLSLGFLSSCSQAIDTPSATQSLETENSTAETALAPTTTNQNFVVEALDRVEPAVVQIEVSQTVRRQVPDTFQDPFFRRFFGDMVPEQPSERTVEGLGSGFVISEDGLILTNAHVVSKADTVNVTFQDGTVLEGEVVGQDPLSDVAVLRVDTDNLPTVPLGNSDQVRPGQWAIAIGNPLGLEQTVTVGVISATDRSSSEVGVPDKRLGFLQTDAAINPGNSGGPLVNAQGEVIGINTAIIGGAQGLGFAIPINAARQIAQELIETGRVQYPYLGIRMAALTPQLKQRLENDPRLNVPTIDANEGILVVEVMPNSPADKAGLQPGDVIRQINGEAVTAPNEVQELVDDTGIGNELQVQLQRQGRSVSLEAQLEPLPTETP